MLYLEAKMSSIKMLLKLKKSVRINFFKLLITADKVSPALKKLLSKFFSHFYKNLECRKHKYVMIND